MRSSTSVCKVAADEATFVDLFGLPSPPLCVSAVAGSLMIVSMKVGYGIGFFFRLGKPAPKKCSALCAIMMCCVLNLVKFELRLSLS